MNLVCWSKWLNTLFGGVKGKSLSYSSRELRKTSKFWSFMHWLLNKMFVWQKNHCRQVWLRDKFGRKK